MSGPCPAATSEFNEYGKVFLMRGTQPCTIVYKHDVEREIRRYLNLVDNLGLIAVDTTGLDE